MESHVEALFTPAVKAELAASFAVAFDDLELIGEFENYVYRDAARERIIRVSHRTHRSESDIEAELQWISALVDQGIPLVRPLVTDQDLALAVLSDGEFFACAFQWAPGRCPSAEDFTPELFEIWGIETGRLHAAASMLPDQQPARFDWRQDPYTIEAPKRLSFDAGLLAAFQTQQMKLNALPRSVDVYGLIHNDLHQHNFHLHQGSMLIFDTDDCCRHWYVQDIAVILYHAMWHWTHAGEGNDFACWFFPHFWRGYARHFTLDREWLELVPELLLWRDLIMITVLREKLGHKPDDRYHSRMARLTNNVLTASPCINVDLSRLARSA